ncbi:MAG: FlgD immunoglobulin-like domain containing protein [Candidatus Eiseniibacteriota bacterium]
MLRHTGAGLALTMVLAGPTLAGTFDRTPIAPELGVDALNKGVAREQLGRDVFSNPYATVTIGNVDVYDVFPYVEARHFQIVSDPAWNRLVYGELGKDLKALDGGATAFGRLAEPRGLAVDGQNTVYVADSGNDRILVFKAVTEYSNIELVPQYEIGGLKHPYDVAHSDGGTPFDAADDHLYVADTGANRIVAFALSSRGATREFEIGALGSGPGHFAGPMAIAVGRMDGVNTADLYVADAHSRRIVHLRSDGGRLSWIEDRRHEADVVTALDTDQWGNVYAAAPNRGVVSKFGPDLSPVAELATDVARPRSFHVPFVNVRDHRSGTIERRGQPNGVLIEDWNDASGMKLWSLGVEVADLAVVGGEESAVRFTLTDRANVNLEISDPSSGRTLSRRSLGALAAGLQSLPLTAADIQAATGGRERLVRVTAASAYGSGASDVAQASFTANANGAVLPPSVPVLLGNTPNPGVTSTRISFLLPDGLTDEIGLRILDARGRTVRTLDRRANPGLNEVLWDGRDDRGRPTGAGVYFYTLTVQKKSLTGKMVFVH